MDTDWRVVKEPWLAASLSLELPGVGQMYAGAWVAGLLFLVGALALSVAAQVLVFAPRGSYLAAGLLLLALIALWILNIVVAHRCARKANSAEAEAARHEAKDPYLAVFLTRIMPGIGHLYLRRWWLGAGLILVTMALWVVGGRFLVAGLFFFPLYRAGACLLAYVAGPPERRRGRAGIAGICVLGLACGLAVLVTAFGFRHFLIHAFRVPGGSMSPTIRSGDRILVWKPPFTPRRGDVVVHLNPWDRSVRYVHRVAAVEGETIEFKGDGIYVNGAMLTEGAFGRLRYEPAHVPPNTEHFADEGHPYTVPPGHLFMVGDNVARSFDSRLHGPVPVNDVVGKAYKRYWPLDRVGPIE